LQVDFIEAGGFGESHKIALVEIDHKVRHAAAATVSRISPRPASRKKWTRT
jgi:hypothetical protein